MGYSYQVFHGRSALFEDYDLLVLVLLLVERLGSTGDERLPDVVRRWKAIFEGYGPGVVELALDDGLRSAEDIAELVDAACEVRSELAHCGDRIAGERLNGLVSTGDLKFADYKVSRVLDALDGLLRLVQPEQSRTP